MAGEPIESPALHELWEDIATHIQRAVDTAPPVSELEKEDTEMANVGADFIKGRITREEYERKFPPITGSEPGVAIFETVSEMNEALRKVAESLPGIDMSQIEREMAHENSHALIALKYGGLVKYVIRFFRHPNGQLSLIPGVEIRATPLMSDDEYRAMEREVLTEVEDPSPSDEASIKLLKD